MSRIAITRQEWRQIARVLRTADKQELCSIQHMAERYLKTDSPGVWAYYLPDFTRLFKDWYRLYICQVVVTYRVKASWVFAERRGVLALKFVGERPRDKVLRSFETGDFAAVKQLLHDADRALLDCQSELARAQSALRHGRLPGNLAVLIRMLTKFVSFGLDSVIPERLLEQRFPYVQYSQLANIGISSWLLAWNGALKVLESFYHGSITWKGAVARHRARFARLYWGDMNDRMRDQAFSRRMLEKARKRFPDLFSLLRYEAEQKERRLLEGSPELRNERYLQACLRRCPKPDRELLSQLAKFISRAQEYNEQRRMVFTEGLLVLRTVCERAGLDWRIARLAEMTSVCS